MATWVLGVLTAAVVAGSIWFAVDPQGWRTLEDDIGPVRAWALKRAYQSASLIGGRRQTQSG